MHDPQPGKGRKDVPAAKPEKVSRGTLTPKSLSANKKQLASINDLAPDPENPHEADQKTLDAIGYSIEEFGDISGIVWNRTTGQLVCGHKRLAQLKAAHGEKLIFHQNPPVIETPNGNRFPIRVVDWDIGKQRAANIAANSPHLQGHFTPALNPQLQAILAENEERFNALRLGKLLDQNIAKEGKTEPDALPATPKKPITKEGDLWLLGKHRLLCGDSTSEADITRLMAGERAHALFTDPPYGVSYDSQGKDHLAIKGDGKRRDDLIQTLLLPAFKNAVKHSLPTAAFYIFHASSTREDFAYAIKHAGLIENQYLIWAKNTFVLGHADYHWGHEPFFYCQKAGEKATFYGDRAQQTVWTASLQGAGKTAAVLASGMLLVDGQGAELYLAPKPPTGKKFRTLRIPKGETAEILTESAKADIWTVSRDTQTDHPTQKPVELPARAIRNSTKANDIVLDIFGGVGSTLIAAEQLGRQARIIEMEPSYCDIIVARYEAFSGDKATREPRGAR